MNVDDFYTSDTYSLLKKYENTISISLEQFQELFDQLPPNKINYLLFHKITSKVDCEVPDDLVKAIESYGMSYTNIVKTMNVSANMIQYIIDNGMESMNANYLIGVELTHTQFLQVLDNNVRINPQILAHALFERDDISLITTIFQLWDELVALRSVDINAFRKYYSRLIADKIVDDETCELILGHIRAGIDYDTIRSYDPCWDGWSRFVKWAGSNNSTYSWNELVAQHIINNLDDLEEAKTDLRWLAVQITE